MSEIIIPAVIIIVIMYLFIFIVFKNIIKRIDENGKLYFIDKVQDYDYIIKDKIEKLNELKEEVKELEKHKEELENVTDDVKEVQNIEISYDLSVPKYREDIFFYNYKELKKNFSFNNENIIRDFVKQHKNTKEEKEYNILKQVKKKFNYDSIYQMLTLPLEDQVRVIKEVITDEEKEYIDIDKIISETKNFDIEKFLLYIEKRMEKVDPIIYVYVTQYSVSYNSIDPNIRTLYYKNMSEGIIIQYRNKIYDYSI